MALVLALSAEMAWRTTLLVKSFKSLACFLVFRGNSYEINVNSKLEFKVKFAEVRSKFHL